MGPCWESDLEVSCKYVNLRGTCIDYNEAPCPTCGRISSCGSPHWTSSIYTHQDSSGSLYYSTAITLKDASYSLTLISDISRQPRHPGGPASRPTIFRNGEGEGGG